MKNILKTFLLIIIFMQVIMINAQTKIIAHRGYWDTPNNAQNSIKSLEMSNKIQVYGTEFDVSITKDGVLVVNHDENIQGIDIENNTFDKIKNLKIKNGETIPTAEQYLIAGKKYPNLKMIYELKPHKTKENEDRAVLETIKLVNKLGVQNQVEYISFSKNICEQLKKQDPKSHVSYLNGDLTPQEVKNLNLDGIDYDFSIFKKNPNWIKDAQKLGLIVNSWTVNNKSDMQNLLDKNIDYITTDKPLILQKLLTK